MEQPPTGAARILVVDDESSITDLVAMALRYEQFAVAVAGGGREALDQVESFAPDLVVLDIMMPGIDGFEVARRLRNVGSRLPILFLTARDATDDKVRGLTLGGDDYMTKPFSVEELVARIRAILRRVQPTEAARGRMVVAHLGLVALGLLVAGVATFTSLRSFLLDRVDQQLREAREPVVLSLSSGSQLPGVTQGPGGPRPSLPPGTYGALLDSSGTVLSKVTYSYGQSGTAVPKLPSPLPTAPTDDSASTVFNAPSSSSSSTGFRVLLQRYPSRGLILEVAVPITETTQTLNRLLGTETRASMPSRR